MITFSQKAIIIIKRQTELYNTSVGVIVEPHQPLVLIVFPTQMINYLRFVEDCGVSSNQEENTS